MKLRRLVRPPRARDFFAQHVRPRRPALLEGLFETSGPRAAWQLESLRQRVGARRVPVELPLVRNLFDPGKSGVRHEWMAVADYLDHIERAPRRGPRRYLAQLDIATAFPELLADVPAPACLADIYCARTALWIGAGDQVTPLHYDNYDNVVYMMQGRKTWTLLAPADSARVYPRDATAFNYSRVDVERPDLRRFPAFAKTRPIVTELHAGEALYVPSGWWHHVRGHGLNIAVNTMWLPPVIP